MTGGAFKVLRGRGMARSRLIVPAVCMLILPVGRAPGSAPWPQSAARPGAQVRLAPLHVPGNESPPQPSRPGGIDVTDPNNPVPGFLCSTERKLWVQTKPCPATYAPSSSAGPTAVRQRPLSRQTLCQYLAYGISVRPESPTGLQSKERNTLLRKNRCGG